MEDRFNIDRHTLKKFIDQGILKQRVVPSSSGRAHVSIFLIKDNKDTLPPKKLTESRSFSEEKDGQTWFRSYPWYKFTDVVALVKDYKIMNHLQITND